MWVVTFSSGIPLPWDLSLIWEMDTGTAGISRSWSSEPGFSMDSRLWWLLPVLALQRGSHLAAGGFLSAPKTPVLGIIGDRVVLPCRVGSAPLPEDFSIRWTFHGRSQRIPVSSYSGSEEPGEQYRGRAEFFHGEFRAGNVSLLLRNVRSSDQGTYGCEISFQDVSQEVLVELEVAAMGEAPSVILRGPEKRDLSVSCRSSGWFPRPELRWLDGRGRVRREPMTTTATVTPEGLFSVESSVRIPPGSDRELCCRVLNRRLGAARRSRIRVHETFFPSISRWLQIFLAVLFLNLALISIISCVLQRSHKRTVIAEKAKLEMEEEKKKLKAVLDGEKAKKRAAKMEFKKHFGQLKSELDFWEARSHAVPVALDAEARPLDLGDAQEPLPVPALVARDALGAGQRYWEVELGRERRWALGVLHSRDPRDPRDELWALRASQGRLFSSGGRALGAQRRPLSALGVFLDTAKARLEFYDVEQKDLVAGIPLGDPTGKFFPFVSQGEEGMLRIRPVPVPVPL
ncbi:butyrophilin subfamily 3 member A2-like isoform X2 [Oenanthe melanoleuca]|uniref:butyrophilin subfamily 3 member A2-like isoform X2 n=1 Tax=Oenanthe melanoleuca TaxID=2939378 RepID=UPI0024C14D65|nr:butyrophilin subfamily 3 member A2-like isoform X2 [Oenanthe melanoleuca]